MALRIRKNHPEIPLDPEKVRIGALLHDIGKALPGEHEINSVEILKKEGYSRLAEIVCHSYPDGNSTTMEERIQEIEIRANEQVYLPDYQRSGSVYTAGRSGRYLRFRTKSSRTNHYLLRFPSGSQIKWEIMRSCSSVL